MARLNLSHHWKFRRLARAVGSPLLARGLLEYLWEAAYEAASDYIGTPADIADAAHWTTSSPETLVRILVEAELFDERTPGVYVVHDLWDHAPKYVRLRWTRAHPDALPPWRREPATTANDRNRRPITDRPSHPCRDVGSSVPRSGTYPPRPAPPQEEEQHRSAARPLPLEDADDTTTALASPSPRPNVRVLVRLAYELGERYETDADLKDALKTIAARYGVAYDATSIARALELLAHARAPLWLTDARPARRQTYRRRSA